MVDYHKPINQIQKSFDETSQKLGRLSRVSKNRGSQESFKWAAEGGDSTPEHSGQQVIEDLPAGKRPTTKQEVKRSKTPMPPPNMQKKI